MDPEPYRGFSGPEPLPVALEQELANLARMIALSRGEASFSCAVYRHPSVRNQVLERLARQSAAGRVIELPPRTDDIYGFVREHLAASESPAAIHLAGLDSLLQPDRDRQRVLQSLNASRELWEAFACPWILWTPEHTEPLLARHAPDLWSYRSHRFDFSMPHHTEAPSSGERPSTGTHPAHNFMLAANLTEDAKQLRIAELQRRLLETASDAPSKTTGGRRVGWLREAAQLLVHSGQPDRALKHLNEAHKNTKGKGEKAATLGDMARIYRSQGRVDEALEMHQEQVSAYEALGDTRSRAVTLGDIARIYVDKGRVDEALEMHQERLSVFDDLGDQAATAQTLWSQGLIHLQENRWSKARALLDRSYRILTQIGRLDGICAVGASLGPLLFTAGQPEQGLTILERSRDGYQQLGQEAETRQVEALIEQIRAQNPPAEGPPPANVPES